LRVVLLRRLDEELRLVLVLLRPVARRARSRAN
jgi:hypothetical protein